MTLEEGGILVSIVSAVLGFIYFIGEKLIKTYWAKADELEKIKETRIKEEIAAIKVIVTNLTNSLRSTEDKIKDLHHTLKANDDNYKRVIVALTEFSKDTIKRFEAIDNSEMVAIGNGKYIFKKGKIK